MKTGMPNIILITIDSLRFDHLGCYGYSRNTSPNIDNLASMGALFLEAVSNGGHTPDSFPSILASVLPLAERDQDKTTLQPRTTLAALLKEVGYQTAAFHSNPFLSRYYGYSKGFDAFSDSLGEYSLFKGRIWMRAIAMRQRGFKTLIRLIARILKPVLFSVVRRPVVAAEEITNQGQSWLKEHKERFFLWLHYMDVHHPYLPLPQYQAQFREQPLSRRKMAGLYRKMLKDQEKLSPTEVTTLIDLYDADIRYVDDTIGWLLESLGSDLVNTIVVITADHGDEFGEHGRFGHASLYDGIVHVPLIIAGPGIKGSTLVKQQVSLLDLAPTICQLVGVDQGRGFQGESLLPLIKGEGGVTKGTMSLLNKPDLGRKSIAYRTLKWKYILTESLDGANTLLSEEVYNLEKDPQERHNLHGSGNRKAKAFESEAVSRIMELRRRQSEQKTAYEKERIRARLKGLPKL